MAKTDKTSNIYINGKQAGETIADLRKKFKELNNEVQHLTPGTENYKKKVAELSSVKGQLDDHTKRVRGISEAYNGVGSSMSGVMNIAKGVLAAGGIAALADMAVKGVMNWINANRQLEKSLSSLRALTGASKEDLEFYKEEAILLGKSTTQSATEVIDAMKLVGSARPELLKNKDALVAVTKETIALAEAAEMEMGPAAQALTGILNQFDLQAEESSRVINVLAAGSQAGAADIESLSQTVDKSGAVMNGYNVSVEEGIGLAETLAEKNIKGAEAGTQLRNVLLTMQGIEALPEKAVKVLESYGVNAAIVADASQPLNVRLAEMAKISGDATAMMQVFGKENIVAATAILGNTEKVQAYTDAVTGTNTAYEQQAINNDNLEGDLLSLSSAWEGLNLTLEGSNGILRTIVQIGTDVLNWITDTINAFRNWDINALENSLLKLGKVFLTWMDPLGVWTGEWKEAIDAQIRFNELAGQVIDKISEQGRSLNILTNALASNNAALKSTNLTLEEENRLKEENAKIIETLSEKYPEFTDQIDFQTASFEELSAWQEIVTENILQQAIEEVKAAEQKRLLNDIIQETIELQKQQAKEAERWAVTNFIADVFTDDAEDMQQNVDKIRDQLNNLDSTFAQVEKSVKGMDLNFSADFDLNNKTIEQTTAELRMLEEQLSSTSGKTNMFVEAQIKAYKSILEQSQKTRQAMIDDELKKEQAKEEQKAEIRKQAASKESDRAAKQLQKDFDKASQDLQKLLEWERATREAFVEQQLLASAEAMEKELMQAQFNIDKKYQKEIESAQRLAARQDEIGMQARERLSTLEILQKEELEAAKAKIEADWTAKNIEAQKIQRQEAAKSQLLIKDAQLKAESAAARLELEGIAEWETEKRQAVLDRLHQLNIQQAELEREQRLLDLELQFENEAITLEEFHAYKEQLEAEHLERIGALNKEAAQQNAETLKQSIESALGAIQQVAGALGAFRDAQHKREMAQIDAQKNSQIKALDEEKRKGLITEEEYQRKLEAINQEAEEKERTAKRKKAEADKKAALINAAIQTALAVISGFAQGGPVMAALAAAVGAINIAAIASQPIPQFKDGGFNVTGAQDGKTYNAKYIGKHPGGMLPDHPVVLASEAGPEYFVPNPLLSNPEVIDHVRAIENIRLRQFAEGGPTTDMPDAPSTPANGAGASDMLFAAILAQLEMNASLMMELREVLPNLAVVIGDEKVDELRERMEQIEAIRA